MFPGSQPAIILIRSAEGIFPAVGMVTWQSAKISYKSVTKEGNKMIGESYASDRTREMHISRFCSQREKFGWITAWGGIIGSDNRTGMRGGRLSACKDLSEGLQHVGFSMKRFWCVAALAIGMIAQAGDGGEFTYLS